MKKLIFVLCLFISMVVYSAEYQRINFNEYKKEIDRLALECASKSMSGFNGFCLSKKYDDSTKQSMTIALQVTAFELFYKKCEHSNFSNVNDLLTRALSIDDAKSYYEEMKHQNEALDIYSNHFDYCKTKDENNLKVSEKLKWFEYMANKYSNGTKTVNTQDIQSDFTSLGNFPEYFVGTFEDTIPPKVGGSIPDTKFLLNCSQAGVCHVKIGENAASKFNTFAPVSNLKYVEYALSYAKEHNNIAITSALSWQANNLKPLLSSQAAIESCVELREKSLPEAYLLLCKLDRDPWAKKAVLLLGTLMSNCGELFCRYEIFPLFKK